MKGNYLTALAIIALVIVSVFAITRPTTIATGVGTTPAQRTITVNGVGTVETSPDEALLTIAVNNQAVTADQAAKDNSNTMSQVLSAILGLSSLNPAIRKEDITTTDYSLTPVYTQPDKCFNTSNPAQPQPVTCSAMTPQLVGYAVTNQIQVTVKDMTSIGRILDAATSVGANEVGGVTFTFTSGTYANLQKQALQKAIQDAFGTGPDDGGRTRSPHIRRSIRNPGLRVPTVHQRQTEHGRRWNIDTNPDGNATGHRERTSSLRNIRLTLFSFFWTGLPHNTI